MDYSRRRTFSLEDVDDKVRKANDRRQSLEAKKIENLTKHNQRAIEMTSKISAENKASIQEMRERIQRSMAEHTERREAGLKDTKHRLHLHVSRIGWMAWRVARVSDLLVMWIEKEGHAQS